MSVQYSVIAVLQSVYSYQHFSRNPVALNCFFSHTFVVGSYEFTLEPYSYYAN